MENSTPEDPGNESSKKENQEDFHAKSGKSICRGQSKRV